MVQMLLEAVRGQAGEAKSQAESPFLEMCEILLFNCVDFLADLFILRGDVTKAEACFLEGLTTYNSGGGVFRAAKGSKLEGSMLQQLANHYAKDIHRHNVVETEVR